MYVDGWPELLLLLAITMVGAVAGPLITLLAGVWLHRAIAAHSRRSASPPVAWSAPAPGPGRRGKPPAWSPGDGPI